MFGRPPTLFGRPNSYGNFRIGGAVVEQPPALEVNQPLNKANFVNLSGAFVRLIGVDKVAGGAVQEFVRSVGVEKCLG